MYEVPPGRDAIANLVPRSVLDNGGVADRHRSCRNFPRKSFGCGNKHEVATRPSAFECMM